VQTLQALQKLWPATLELMTSAEFATAAE